jgi:hypothetical protein
MTTIQSIDFLPPATAELHILRSVGGVPYRRTESLDMTTRPPASQSVVGACIAHIASALPSGYQPERIALSRVPGGIPAVWSTPGPDDDPETYEPVEITPAQVAVLGGILGNHPEHGSLAIPQGTVGLPDDLRIALLAEWAAVEAAL